MKIPQTLRTRMNTCASLIGATVPEFCREAIRDKCEQTERLEGQRSRAAKAVADEGGK